MPFHVRCAVGEVFCGPGSWAVSREGPGFPQGADRQLEHRSDAGQPEPTRSSVALLPPAPDRPVEPGTRTFQFGDGLALREVQLAAAFTDQRRQDTVLSSELGFRHTPNSLSGFCDPVVSAHVRVPGRTIVSRAAAGAPRRGPPVSGPRQRRASAWPGGGRVRPTAAGFGGSSIPQERCMWSRRGRQRRAFAWPTDCDRDEVMGEYASDGAACRQAQADGSEPRWAARRMPARRWLPTACGCTTHRPDTAERARRRAGPCLPGPPSCSQLHRTSGCRAMATALIRRACIGAGSRRAHGRTSPVGGPRRSPVKRSSSAAANSRPPDGHTSRSVRSTWGNASTAEASSRSACSTLSASVRVSP